MALTNASTPCTAMPSNLNGRSRIQTSGYSKRAAIATGQHATNSKHHNRNLIMPFSIKYALMQVEVQCELQAQFGFHLDKLADCEFKVFPAVRGGNLDPDPRFSLRD